MRKIMKYHELKTWPEMFDAIYSGEKTFEWRKDDRGFNVGDAVLLREYDPFLDVWTGREIPIIIRYVLRNAFDVPPGYCVFSFIVIDRKPMIPITKHSWPDVEELLKRLSRRSPFQRFYVIKSGSQFIIDTSEKLSFGQTLVAILYNDQITLIDHDQTTTNQQTV